jgi:hypothetical protein
MRTVRMALASLAVVLLVLSSSVVTGAQSSKHSEQVVFSGVGSCPEFGPVGFWIWCEADSTNPYSGECNGAMYVYSQGITKGVKGMITENESTGAYTMSVVSRDSTLSAMLTNEPPVQRGPKNTVDFTVTIPAGSCTGKSTTAVVKVTGPSE